MENDAETILWRWSGDPLSKTAANAAAAAAAGCWLPTRTLTAMPPHPPWALGAGSSTGKQSNLIVAGEEGAALQGEGGGLSIFVCTHNTTNTVNCCQAIQIL